MANSKQSIINNHVYYHGSNNGKITRFNPPSPDKPLFVTSDIEYANVYVKANTVNGHSRLHESDDGKVYLIKLNSKKIKLFDATSNIDIERLKDIWPEYLLKAFKLKKYSIWSVFKYIVPDFIAYYGICDEDKEKFRKWIETNVEDELGSDLVIDGVVYICNEGKFKSAFKDIFKKVKIEDKQSTWDALFKSIAVFNHSLVDLGYNAFRNIERTRNVVTNDAIGIMSVDALESLSPVPLSSVES